MAFDYSIQNVYRNEWYNYGPTISNYNFYGSAINYQQLLYYLYGGFGGFGGFGFGGFGGFGMGIANIYGGNLGFSYNSITPIYRNILEKNDIIQTGKAFDYKFSSVDGRVQEGTRLVNSQWVGRRDPVILDIDGDGKATVTDTDYQVNRTTITTTKDIGRDIFRNTYETTTITNKGKENGIEFDINGDGIKDRTQWVKAQGDKTDAFVVYLTPEQQKLLAEGKYDQIKLDGKNLMTETGINGEQNKYKSGWEKVRDLWDKNGDGKITGDELKNVYIWQDKNGDGKVDKDELKPASAWNIIEIDTNKGTYSRKVGEQINYRQELAGYNYNSFNYNMGFSGYGGFGFGFAGFGLGFGGFGLGFGGFGFGLGFGGFGFGLRGFGFGFGGLGYLIA
jgi:Ca2+-binding EF-hand superfamily protein